MDHIPSIHHGQGANLIRLARRPIYLMLHRHLVPVPLEQFLHIQLLPYEFLANAGTLGVVRDAQVIKVIHCGQLFGRFCAHFLGSLASPLFIFCLLCQALRDRWGYNRRHLLLPSCGAPDFPLYNAGITLGFR